ncbi:unnamed protein product [Sympodiomycopsis kandeliae]
MTRAHSLVRKVAQLSLASGSSTTTTQATSSIRAISTTALRSNESGASASTSSSSSSYPPRRENNSQSSSSSSPGGSAFSRRFNDRQGGSRDRQSAGTGGRTGVAGRSGNTAGGASRGRGRGGPGGLRSPSAASGGRNRFGPRRPRTQAGEGTNIEEETTFVDWYRGPGSESFADPPQGRGPFWISRTPFPMNPSFNPPPPVSQKYKDAMWTLHLQDPQKYNLRFLSQHYGFTLERTQAILRLKALEAEMTTRNVPLQLDFQENMERLIGSNPGNPPAVRKENARNQASSQESDRDAWRRPEHEPELVSLRAGLSASLDNRGSLTEDVTDDVPSSSQSPDESSSTPPDSILLKALEAEQSTSRSKLLATPSGGPDLLYTRKTSPQLKISPSEKHPDRAVMSILDLKQARQDVNYKGAGHLDQNRRRAESRAKANQSKVKSGKKGTASKQKVVKSTQRKVQSELSKHPEA